MVTFKCGAPGCYFECDNRVSDVDMWDQACEHQKVKYGETLMRAEEPSS
jgi:hypothetical protein